MKNTLKISLFVLILAFGVNNTAFATLNQAALQNYAVTKGYGYKSANLFMLKDLIAHINAALKHTKSALRVAVPAFLPIASTEIDSFLKQNGLNLTVQWQKFSQFKPEIKANNGLTPNAEEFLTKLENNIKQIFDTKQFTTSALTTFLKEHKNVQLLMVRSTGKEDTATLANAGGNESLPAKPNLSAISHAIGEVIASYFSKKSLGQRILAASANELNQLFTEKPFVPVLIQRMIGEPLGGITVNNATNFYQLPISGVLFTQEAEGRTPGVTQIQAAFGHGEGVVNSLVPVDTYYINAAGNVNQIIRIKTSRMVPVLPAGARKVSTQAVNNHPVVTKLKTLDANLAHACNIMSKEIEKYYGMPMDVEFVIDRSAPTKPIIYLVQARPIVYKNNATIPSYLQDINVLENPNTCTTIGAAGGALQIITNSNQLIIANNLPEGLRQYLDNPEKANIKAVFTNTMAAATSHEATTLRGQGIPVLYVANLASIASMQPSAEKPLLIDVQRELFGQAKTYKTVQGWFTHPIPMQATIAATNVDNTYAQKILAINTKSAKNKSLKELIEQLKDSTSSTRAQAKILLAAIIKKVIALYNSDELSIEDRKEIKTLVNYILARAKNIEAILATTAQKRSLALLYEIKFLEAALFQPYNADIVQGESLFTIMRTLQKITEAKQQLTIKHDVEKAPYLEILMTGTAAAIGETQEQAWKTFINKLQMQATANDIQKFATNIAVIQQFNAFDTFLNDNFMHYPTTSVQDTLTAFYSDFEQSKGLLQTLQHYKNLMKNVDLSLWQDPQKLWQDPQKFNTQWKHFSTILAYFVDDNPTQGFNYDFAQAGNIGKKVALSVMKDLVDLFDASIKNITGTPNYPLEKKVSNAATMVQQLFDLFKQWTHLYPTVDANNDSMNNWLARFILLVPNTFQIIDNIMKQDNSTEKITALENQLNISPDFIVQDFCYPLDSGGSTFTLEELFTFAHQNLLNLISLLNSHYGTSTIALPQFVAATKHKIERIVINNFEDYYTSKVRPKLLTTELQNNGLSIKYFFPLRAHNANIDLQYKKNRVTTIELFFYGENEDQRWDHIENLIKSFKQKYPTINVNTQKNEASLKITWTIAPKNQPLIKKVINTIKQAAAISLKPMLYTANAEIQSVINAAGTTKLPYFGHEPDPETIEPIEPVEDETIQTAQEQAEQEPSWLAQSYLAIKIKIENAYNTLIRKAHQYLSAF